MVSPNLENLSLQSDANFQTKFSSFYSKKIPLLYKATKNTKYKQNTRQIKFKGWLCTEWSSGNKSLSMGPTDGEMNVNFMNFLFTHLSPVPVYGIAHIHSIDNIVQNMHKV